MSTNKIEINHKTFLLADEALGDLEQEITIGEMIKSLRKCEDLTLTELAKRLNVNKQYLLDIEHGKKQANIEFIKHFCRIIETPADSLLEIYFQDNLRRHGIHRIVSLKKAS